jgi:UDP-N-acetylmuramyl tripeptide synthase
MYEDRWSCGTCGLKEPDTDYQVDEFGAVSSGGRGVGILRPGLPGGFNLLNALAASLAVAVVTGAPLGEVAERLSLSSGVEGRFATWWLTGCSGTPSLVTYLAKNPAGWHANLSVVDVEDSQLVLGLNARIADGRDTSWIWDVEFERLGPRPVIVTGERALDLALRLEVAGFAVEVVRSQIAAIRLGAERSINTDSQRIVYLANYTAFRSLIDSRAELGALLGLAQELRP